MGFTVTTYGGPSGSIKFTYDGLDVVRDDSSVSSITKYQNGPGIDNKLQSRTGSAVKYFLTDHLGSTNGLADATGSLTAQTGYDAFGSATNAAFPTRYQFTGREYDSFTGLQFSRARFYDPRLGRFISEDPIGFAGGDVNLYGYVRNNPLKLKDPTGRIPVAIIVVGGVLLVEGTLHLYLQSRANSINWPDGDPKGRSRHCYVNCMSVRAHLGNSGPVGLAGLAQEAVNLYQGAPLDDTIGDLNANAEGMRKAVIVWKSCEELCRTCP